MMTMTINRRAALGLLAVAPAAPALLPGVN